jgi:hypothetical protein
MVSSDFVLSSATRRLMICSMGGAYLVVPQVSLWLMARSIWTVGPANRSGVSV